MQHTHVRTYPLKCQMSQMLHFSRGTNVGERHETCTILQTIQLIASLPTLGRSNCQLRSRLNARDRNGRNEVCERSTLRSNIYIYVRYVYVLIQFSISDQTNNFTIQHCAWTNVVLTVSLSHIANDQFNREIVTRFLITIVEQEEVWRN